MMQCNVQGSDIYMTYMSRAGSGVGVKPSLSTNNGLVSLTLGDVPFCLPFSCG